LGDGAQAAQLRVVVGGEGALAAGFVHHAPVLAGRGLFELLRGHELAQARRIANVHLRCSLRGHKPSGRCGSSGEQKAPARRPPMIATRSITQPRWW
jgi:hypothetical protein